MGVAHVFHWLKSRSKQPLVTKFYGRDVRKRVDNLYIDMNSAIYSRFPTEMGNRDFLLGKLSDSVFKFIEDQVLMMKPKRLLYLCLDGAAPLLKIPLQQRRRIKNFELDISQVAKGLGSELNFNTLKNQMLFRCEVSPGSNLMSHLSSRIKLNIEKKRQCDDRNWAGLKVILSDSNVPGEGEHKAFTFIKGYGFDVMQSHAIYSPDTDCRILALLTHEEDLFVYFSPPKGMEPEPQLWEDQFYEKTEMAVLRNMVTEEVLRIKAEKSPAAKRRQIEDFGFMCNLWGNDYFPPPAHPKLDLQDIIDSYHGNSDEYLTTFDQVNHNNILSFLRRLEGKEDYLILSGKKNAQLDSTKRRKENEEERKERLLKEFRQEYYRKHFINLPDVPNLAMNYMKCLRSIWQSIITGSAEFKGSYCLKFAPLIVDMVMSNSKVCWERGAPGSHLEPLAHLILILPPQCVDMLPERYRRFRMRSDVLKLYGEAAVKDKKEKRTPECDIDSILESLRREGLQSTLKVEENGSNIATEALFFPSCDGAISENVIRSDEVVPTTIKEPSLRPFKFTLRADDMEKWCRRLER